MEYIVEAGITLYVLVMSYFGIRKLIKMEDKVTDHESRLKVEESKGTARDTVANDIKELLHDIAGDISTIKAEQGYWRGRHDQEQTN